MQVALGFAFCANTCLRTLIPHPACTAATFGGAIYSASPASSEPTAVSLMLTGTTFQQNRVDDHEVNITPNQDLHIESGTVSGDTSCTECEASRRAGGLTSGGSCNLVRCANCENPLYTCTSAKGRRVVRHQKSKSGVSGGEQLVWW